MKTTTVFAVLFFVVVSSGCKKDGGGGGTNTPPAVLHLLNVQLGSTSAVLASTNYNVAVQSQLKLKFDKKISRAQVQQKDSVTAVKELERVITEKQLSAQEKEKALRESRHETS